MASLLSRLLGRGRQDDEAVEHETDEGLRTTAERHFVDESVEGHKTDTYVEEHGMTGIPQIDTNDEFRPPRDY